MVIYSPAMAGFEWKNIRYTHTHTLISVELMRNKGKANASPPFPQACGWGCTINHAFLFFSQSSFVDETQQVDVSKTLYINSSTHRNQLTRLV